MAVIGIESNVADFNFWSDEAKSVTAVAQGSATAQEAPNPAEIHNGKPALRIDAKAGSWSVTIKPPWYWHDITSFEALTFAVRVSAGSAPPELMLSLTDKPAFSAPTTTSPVPVLHGLALTGDYQRVTVPLSSIFSASPGFQTDRVGAITLSGQTTGNATLFIDGLQALVRADSALPANGPSSQ